MSGDPVANVELVRTLFAAWERGGVDAVMELVDDDVEWSPPDAPEAGTLREETREHHLRREELGTETQVTAYGFEAVGPAVIVSGTTRVHSRNGFADSQHWWVYFFRDGRLVRASTYPDEEAARAAIAAWEGGG